MANDFDVRDAQGDILTFKSTDTAGVHEPQHLAKAVASEVHVGQMGGKLASVSVEITRPADTTAYIALDIVAPDAGTVLTFSDMARLTGGSGYITKALLLTTQKTCVARFRLHLFNAAPTAIPDNDPYSVLYSNAAKSIGTIDFPACITEDPTTSTAAVSQVVGMLLPFVCAATAHLYGALETLDAFTPASAQKVTIKLTADQN